MLFAYSLDADQSRRYIGSDLDDTLIVLPKAYFSNVDLEEYQHKIISQLKEK